MKTKKQRYATSGKILLVFHLWKITFKNSDGNPRIHGNQIVILHCWSCCCSLSHLMMSGVIDISNIHSRWKNPLKQRCKSWLYCTQISGFRLEHRKCSWLSKWKNFGSYLFDQGVLKKDHQITSLTNSRSQK